MLALVAPLALTACGSGDSSDRPGGLSQGEARAIDEAAEMLDRQQLPDGAVPPVDLPVAEQAPTDGEAGEDEPSPASQDPE